MKEQKKYLIKFNYIFGYSNYCSSAQFDVVSHKKNIDNGSLSQSDNKSQREN